MIISSVLPFTFNGAGEFLPSDFRLNCKLDKMKMQIKYKVFIISFKGSAEHVLTRPKNVKKTTEKSLEKSFKPLLNIQEKKLRYSGII